MSALGAPQPEASRTEAELVAAARAGSDRAFGELYERYGGRIFGYVLGLVRDRGRVEDIVQDIFVSALRRIKATDREIAFKPWIFEIAKNACIDEFRRLERSREIPMEQDSRERLTSAAPSPHIDFERGQQLAALHGAFRGLSERQHKVLVLRELEGLSYTEIADRTGMTLPMVESTLLRARRRLGQEYDDIASGRRCEQVHLVVDAGGQAAVSALGLRERRRFVRHIVHCQPCARYARMAGIAEPERRLPAAVKRLAGLLPLPLTRWPFGGEGHAARGLMRSARRVAQLAHPGASVTATPATVATVAAVVIASGGAAVELISHKGAAAGRATPPAVTARPTAATRTQAASPRKLSVRMDRAAGTTASQHTVGADRSAARSGQSSNTRGSGSSGGQSSSSSRGSSGSTSAPSAPSSPSSRPTQSSPQTPALPQLPQVPTIPQVVQTLHKVTNPLHQITNPLKKLLPPIGLHLPGLLEQLGQTTSTLPSLDR